MTFVKVIAEILFFVTFCRGQFLTPELLREQHELSYSARTHYETSGSQRTDAFNRVNPDYLLYGFFPFWSIILIAFAFVFLALSFIGLIGYYFGLRRPSFEELYGPEFDQLTPDEEFLLGTGTFSRLNETKYLDQQTRYESLLPIDRTPIRRSHEHTV